MNFISLEKYSKKQIFLFFVISVLQLALGFAGIFYAAYLQKKDCQRLLVNSVGIVGTIIAVCGFLLLIFTLILIFLPLIKKAEEAEYNFRITAFSKKIMKSNVQTISMKTEPKTLFANATRQGYMRVLENMFLKTECPFAKKAKVFLFFSLANTKEEIEKELAFALQALSENYYCSTMPRIFFIFTESSNCEDVNSMIQKPLDLRTLFPPNFLNSAIYSPQCFVIACNKQEKVISYNAISVVEKFVADELSQLDK